MRRCLVLACLCALLPAPAARADEQSLTFTLHNLHFQKFEASGYTSDGGVVHAVHRDRKGRLWIGSEGGLFLYDGNEVRTFSPNRSSRDWLPSHFAKAIAEAPDGTIWIGTWGNGFAFFDETSRSMQVPDIATGEAGGRRFDGKIWSMVADKRGRLWLGTFTSGLFLYDPATGNLRPVFQPEAGTNSRAWRIDSLFIDDRERLWFAPTGDRLHVIDTQTLEPVELDLDVLETRTRAGGVKDIAAFSDGRMIILQRRGVRLLDHDGNLLRSFDLPTSNEDGIPMEALPYGDNSVLVGTGNRLWYVDVQSGATFPLPAGTRLAAIEPMIVWDMDVTSDGDLLIGGTHGTWFSPAVSRQFWTLAIRDGDNDIFFENTRAIAYRDKAILLNSVSDIYRIDFDGTLDRPRLLTGSAINRAPIGYPLTLVSTARGFWLGNDERILHIDHAGGINMRPGYRGSVHALLHDPSTNRILAHRSSGLLEINASDGVIANATAKEHEHTPHSYALHLSFGGHDDVWAGTFTGLYRYNRRTLAALPSFAVQPPAELWKDPLVGFVHPLSNDTMLIGTGAGLYTARLDDTGAIAQLTREFAGTALETESFGAVFETEGDELLLAMDSGLIRFNPETGEYKALFHDDGLVTYRSYMASFYQSQNLAVLSGIDGPLLFVPDDIRFNAAAPTLVISDVLSFRGNDTKVWPLAEGLEFLYEDKVIRVKFGLLDYLMQDNNQYQLRLKGLSDAWLNIGRLNEFSFTNLDPGSYQLEVRATDGIVEVPEAATMKFAVLPPWWQTWWAYTMYVVIILGTLIGYWMSLQRKIARERDISRQLREADRIKSHFLNELEEKVELATQDLRHAVEALEIKNIELGAAQQRALDASRLKSEFLANMSHEIRTPMNGVLGFTQLLGKSTLDHEQRDYLETIEKSAISLLGIINDVLDVSKVEAGKMMIDSTGFDLRQCVSDTLEALTPIAYEKNLELIGHVEADLPDGLRGDPVRLRQMITNLVGNAVKFTDQGQVRVHAERLAGDEPWLRIAVHDTGRGITPEDRERLFQAFERGQVSLAGRYTGTGLGLVITKKLCEAMGGRIELDSVPGEGTTIALELPLVPDRNPENRYGYGKPLAGRKVLLIDPNTDSRESLRARLAHWGADVNALAQFVLPPEDDIDLVVIGIERSRLGETRGLRTLCERLPEAMPRLCLAATIDHEALRSLSKACGAACLPKVGHKEAQLRRMLDLLGVSSRELEIDAAPAVRQQLKELHVVVADDNRINRYFLKKILELHGARVTEADSGSAVLRILDAGENPASSVDIALLDVHMPDIDGLEVARRIRARGDTRLPLLAISANVQPETYEAAFAAGINDYLLKPVEENKLVEAVLEWTGREEVTSD